MGKWFYWKIISIRMYRRNLYNTKKIAPLGGTIIINFRGFDIALRKKESSYIKIKYLIRVIIMIKVSLLGNTNASKTYNI